MRFYNVSGTPLVVLSNDDYYAWLPHWCQWMKMGKRFTTLIIDITISRIVRDSSALEVLIIYGPGAIERANKLEDLVNTNEVL